MEFNKFNNADAWMSDSIYHMAFKYIKILTVSPYPTNPEKKVLLKKIISIFIQEFFF